jgi:hypothetical protein
VLDDSNKLCTPCHGKCFRDAGIIQAEIGGSSSEPQNSMHDMMTDLKGFTIALVGNRQERVRGVENRECSGHRTKYSAGKVFYTPNRVVNLGRDQHWRSLYFPRK